MKIFLSNPPWNSGNRKGVRAGSRWPHLKIPEEEDYMPYPFFLGYTSSLLKKNRFNVKTVDAIAQNLNKTEFLSLILKFNPDLIFLEISTPSLESDLDLIKEIKKKTNKKIIVACPDTNLINIEFLKKNNFIDFGVYGEYEFTLLDLATAIKNKKKFSNILGLIYKNKSGIIENPRRDLIDIDSLPWPDREDMPGQNYHDCPGSIPMPSAQMIASRGCPYNCTFCAWPQLVYGGRNYRTRSVKDVVDEMEFLIKKKGFKSIYFDDDTFNIGKKRMLEFAQELKKRNWRIPWAFMGRADLVDEEILGELRYVGLSAVKYGIESAVQEIVDKANKKLDIKKAEQNILLTKNYGIKVHLTFTFGLPGETKDSIMKTIDFAIRTNPESVQFSILTPFPGTKFYEQLKKEGKIVSDNLNMYDGNSQSVIKTDELTSDELTRAKIYAYKKWEESKKNKKINSPVNLFFSCLKEHSLSYTFNHTINYISKNYIQPIRRKKSDILLVNCPPWGLENPPFSLAYLESFIESKGFKTDIIDFNIELFNSHKNFEYLWDLNYKNYWRQKHTFEDIKRNFSKDISNLVKRIVSHPAKVIGFSVSDPRQFITRLIVKEVKRINPNKIIVIGGPYYLNGDMSEEKNFVDLFVIGGGETTLVEILKRVKSGKTILNISNTKYFDKKTNSIIQNKITNSNSPFSLKNYSYPKYRNFNLKLYKTRSICVEWSRGCIGHCSFCQNPIHQKNFQIRDAINIVEEIEYNVNNNKVEFLSLIDPALNGSIRNLEKVCDLIIKKKIKVKWSGLAIPRKEMSLKLLKKMYDAGCVRLEYGIESGSDLVLKKMNKLHRSDEAGEVLKNTSKAGISSVVYLMVGHPGETKEEFKKTLKFLEDNKNYISLVRSINSPYLQYGTPLMEHPEKFNLDIDKSKPNYDYNWKTKDNLNTVKERERRVKEVIKQIHKLNIPFELHTLNESKKLTIDKNNMNDFDIVLVLTPFWTTKMPHVGLAYIASYLKSKNIKLKVLDLNIDIFKNVDKKTKLFWDVKTTFIWNNEKFFEDYIQKYAEEIARIRCNTIAFSIMASTQRFSYKLIEAIKQKDPSKIIVTGGLEAPPEHSNIIDYHIKGDGEYKLFCLINELKKCDKKNQVNIPGIIVYEQGEKRFTPEYKNIDFRLLPFPTYEHFNLHKYEDEILTLVGSKGCIQRCVGCCDWPVWKTYTNRKAEQIVEEIKYHITKNYIKNFSFGDLLMNGDIKELEKMCDLIISNKLNVVWSGNCIIRPEMNLKLLKKMKQAGCGGIDYGVESGSNKIIKNLGKKFTYEEAKKVIRDTHNSGIHVNLNFMVGFPGETNEDFEKTLDFVKENHKYINSIPSLATTFIMPNSFLEKFPEKYGIDISMKNYIYNWVGKGGNTNKLRIKRAKILKSVIEDLKINLGETKYVEDKI